MSGLISCPICGISYPQKDTSPIRDKKCSIDFTSDEDFAYIYCHHFNFYCYIHNNILNMEDEELQGKLLNLATEHLLHHNFYEKNGGKKRWYFYFNDISDGMYGRYPEYMNLANSLKNYPIQTLNVAHRALVNFSVLYPHYGDEMCPSWTEKRICFENESNNTHSCGIMRILEDFGYVKEIGVSIERYVITASGWQKINDLNKEEQIINQGFIAMCFDAETKSIREAFRTAIRESGYTERIIDEKEHNNQIVPEIFYEIERSKFVVVDVTYPNYGAYYEAGYAQALGKQVIVCCREEEFNSKDKKKRPHFDISQKSMIVWKDEADLIERLKKRIEATVN